MNRCQNLILFYSYAAYSALAPCNVCRSVFPVAQDPLDHEGIAGHDELTLELVALHKLGIMLFNDPESALAQIFQPDCPVRHPGDGDNLSRLDVGYVQAFGREESGSE